jgi:hypothetical protein
LSPAGVEFVTDTRQTHPAMILNDRATLNR